MGIGRCLPSWQSMSFTSVSGRAGADEALAGDAVSAGAAGAGPAGAGDAGVSRQRQTAGQADPGARVTHRTGALHLTGRDC